MVATSEIAPTALTELLFAEAGVALCLVAPDGSVVRANAEWLRSTGVTIDDALGEDVIELFPHVREMTLALHARARAGHTVVVPPHLERIGGRETWWEGSISPVPMEGGTGLLIVAREVVPSARAASTLREVQAVLDKLEATFASITEGVMVYSPDGRCVRLNAAAEEIMGVPRAELLAAESVEARVKLLRMQTPEGATFPACETPAWKGLHGESSRNVEMVLHKQTGEEVWLSSSGAPVRGTDGEVHGAVVTFSDVTHEKRAEHALREANEQLREAARRKDEFLGMLSHELRNPLAPIRNSIYILRHAEPGGARARRARHVIERQTEHLTRVVDDLLDVTRIARGKIELRRERVDLRDVVRRIAEDFRTILDDRGITFDVDVPRANVWADADATRVAQMIGNVLHNAAKYSRRDDQVTLTLRTDGADAVMSVRDTGAGMDAALLPHVFEPFVQGRRTLARTEGGLGLGLALVKGIAELHGGTVRADSAGVGQGTTIVVRLPLVAPPVLARGAKEVARRANGGRRVLVVDDNHDAAESLGEIATMLGHTVEVVYDGPSALERARVSPPDVVLCDVGMPEMSGYDVARALRASLGNAVRLVAVTGYAQPDDVREAVEAGFDRHIAKPASIDDVERLLADEVPHDVPPAR